MLFIYGFFKIHGDMVNGNYENLNFENTLIPTKLYLV